MSSVELLHADSVVRRGPRGVEPYYTILVACVRGAISWVACQLVEHEYTNTEAHKYASAPPALRTKKCLCAYIMFAFSIITI